MRALLTSVKSPCYRFLGPLLSSPSLFVEEEEGEDVFDFCPSGTVLFPFIFTYDPPMVRGTIAIQLGQTA